MKYIFILDKRSKRLRSSGFNPTITKVFCLSFCFAACSFFNSANAQTDKAKKTEQREQLLTQLDANMSSFLSTVRNKREQNQQQLEELRMDLEKFQSRKPNKKTRAMDEQIEQSLLRKIANLENKDKEYQKMEEEAMTLLSDLGNLSNPGGSRTRLQTDNLAQGQENGNGEAIFFSERMQNQEDMEYGAKTNTQSGNMQENEQFYSEIDATVVAQLVTIQTSREQNQQQLEEARTELKQHQAKKTNNKTQVVDMQIEQSLEKKIANLEKKDKEYQKMEEDAIAKTNLTYTQSGKNRAGTISNTQQNEHLLTQLDANVSYLATIQTKREQNQQQMEEVRVELEEHQAKKTTKKTRAADEQMEQALERKLANLENKDKEFQKIEEEAVANISSVMESIAQSQQSTVAQSSQKQGNQIAFYTEEPQNQTQQKNTSNNTSTQTKTSTNQTQSSSTSSAKNTNNVSNTNVANNTGTTAQSSQTQGNQIAYYSEEPQNQTQQKNTSNNTNTQTKTSTSSTQSGSNTNNTSSTNGTSTFAQNSSQSNNTAQNQQSNNTQNSQTQGNQTVYYSEESQNQTQQKNVATANANENVASYLANIQTKREQNQQQLTETQADLEKHQAKKTTKKTRAADEQIEQALERKIANLENKDKEYQKMEQEAIALQTTAQNNQSYASTNGSNSSAGISAQNQQNQTNVNSKTTTSASTQEYAQNQNSRSTTSTSTQKSTSTTTQGYTQTQPRSTSGNQASTSSQNTRVTYGYQPVNGNVTTGYYVVFGSFIDRNNATKFLSKLQTRFSNVMDIGNDNEFGMYRTGIGPYVTKEEALAQRPTDMKNWVLRVETIPNTRMLAYIEILEIEE